jgi:hypothetical protein
MSFGQPFSKLPAMSAIGSLQLACKALSRLQEERDFTSWSLFNQTRAGMTLRHSRKRSQRQWLRRGRSVTSPQSRSAHAPLASLSIICGTAAAPPQLRHIRLGRCRGRRFRHPSIGTSFHPDFVRTTSQSGPAASAFVSQTRSLGVHFQDSSATAATPS